MPDSCPTPQQTCCALLEKYPPALDALGDPSVLS
eukprot:CAMPEP_0172591616 /NCGR_PEP_ID=MMETSP1068-20121228/10443_1 /TAXON_ID=35684 /ORGANISM="Pseudopedinella elastica, Strain CCMP716" /LENGTH=33 /DNA_ID= /DNA_START= /DNA_END= /DNA_ORIENTATION=